MIQIAKFTACQYCSASDTKLYNIVPVKNPPTAVPAITLCETCLRALGEEITDIFTTQVVEEI